MWPNAIAPVERERHAEGAEDLGQQRGVVGGSAQHDGDLLGRDAVLTDQPRGLRRHELELGPLTAALQQRDRGAGIDRVGIEELRLVELEEPALEMVQRRARAPPRSARRAP